MQSGAKLFNICVELQMGEGCHCSTSPEISSKGILGLEEWSDSSDWQWPLGSPAPPPPPSYVHATRWTGNDGEEEKLSFLTTLNEYKAGYQIQAKLASWGFSLQKTHKPTKKTSYMRWKFNSC